MQDSHHDRNLLLGMLALQLGLVSKEPLLLAFHAWAGDKSKSLDEVLHDLHTVTSDGRALLWEITQKHIDFHGGQPAQSLAALNAGADIHSALTQLGDKDLRASLAYVSIATLPATESKLGLLSIGRTTSSGTRFRILRPHAKGGLGQVSVARDQEVDRDVAVKEIQPQFVSNNDSRGRFLFEAQITGQLEHPGIVPVYGLGTYDDGRPYYAMRFVQGQNLNAAIQAFHADRGELEQLEGDRAVAFRNLLRRFLDVCDTIEYAHSRNVLHRDLKPDNVLLGPFGETLVVDWGLAKAMSEKEDRSDGGDAGANPPEATGNGSQTLEGSAIGTPAYMSPEQADGRIADLTAATDIYSLGATLFVLLTGKPPVKGDTVEEALDKIRCGKIERPRPYWSAIPRSLEAICLKALALRPQDRYLSAKALASDLENWLADEPVSAFPEPFAQRIKRWIKRHPAIVSTASATVLLLLFSTLVVAYLRGAHAQELQVKNEALAKKNQTIEDQKATLEKTNSELVIAKNRADSERKIAETNLSYAKKGNEILGSVFDNIDPRSNFETVGDFTDALKANLLMAVKELDGSSIGDALTVAEIQSILGASLDGLGSYTQAVELLEKARATRSAKLGSEHPDTLLTMNHLASAYLGTGNDDLALALYEKTLRLRIKVLGRKHAQSLISMNNVAFALERVKKLDKAILFYEEALQLKKASRGADHPTTLMSMHNLARCLHAAGKYADALPLSEEVVRLRKATLGPGHPDTLMSMGNLSLVYKSLNKLDQATLLCEEVLDLKKVKLGGKHPSTLASMSNLAGMYRNAGKFQRAIPLYEETMNLRKAVLGPDHLDTIASMSNLAYGYKSAGKIDLAIPLYEETLRKRKAILGADDSRTIASMYNLAIALIDAKEFEKGAMLLEEYLIAERKTSKAKDVPFADNLASVTYRLLLAKKFENAEKYARECLAIRQTLEPDVWSTWNIQSMLGGALMGQQKYAEAEVLLLIGFEGLEKHKAEVFKEGRDSFPEAAQRLVELYTQLSKPELVEKWKSKVEEIRTELADARSDTTK